MDIERTLSTAGLRVLGHMLRAGETTSVALTEFYLARLDGPGRTLNAVAALDPDGAHSAAAKADAELANGRDRGPLHGIPFAVKDIFATQPPLPTSWGVAALGDRQFKEDAVAVARLRAAGAILLGKLAMMELAAMLPFETFDASATGPCRNPYNLDSWTGDSSTGSAAAVGGGLIPFALATETRGSIIQPAAFCGAVGLRPSAGAVSLDGVMPVSSTIDRVGPIARSAEDCLLVFHAIADKPVPRRSMPARSRIGIIAPEPARDDADVIANFDAVASTLSRSAELTIAKVPNHAYEGVYHDIVVNEAKLNFRSLIDAGITARLVSPDARDGSYLAAPVDNAALYAALSERQRLLTAWTRWASRFDVLITTTNPKVAPPLDTTFTDYFGENDHEPITTIGAVLGLPAMTVPTGFGERGLPTGMQFVGLPESEAVIAHIVGQYSEAFPQMSFHN